MTDVNHTCPTHGVAAALSCARCGTFVCRRCKLWHADVGVVCDPCAAKSRPPPQSDTANLFIPIVQGGMLLFATGAWDALPSPFMIAFLLGCGGCAVSEFVTERVRWNYAFAIAFVIFAFTLIAFGGGKPGLRLFFAVCLLIGDVIFALLVRWREKARRVEKNPKWRNDQLIR